MSSKNRTAATRKIAEEHGADPDMALRCMGAAGVLASRIDAADRIVWPLEHGGAAWRAVAGLKPDGPAGDGGTVFAVVPRNHIVMKGAWSAADAAVSARGRRIRIIELLTSSEREPAMPTVESAGTGNDASSGAGDSPAEDRGGALERLLRRLLNRLEGGKAPDDGSLPGGSAGAPESKAAVNDAIAAETVPGPEDGVLIIEPPDSGGGKVPNRTDSGLLEAWIDAHDEAFAVPDNGSLRERTLLARCGRMAGLVPVMNIRSGEAAAAAASVAEMDGEDGALVLRLDADWAAVAAFRGCTECAVLSPASAEDAAGAMDRSAAASGVTVIVDPGKEALPVRAALKKPWVESGGIIVREKAAGDAGRILLAVPGIMAREASRAADRLGRDNIASTVLAMRYLHPVDLEFLKKAAAGFDLVILADPAEFAGNFTHTAGPVLLKNSMETVVMAEAGLDGRGLADLASGILRENRIRRAVDDVREDRWRG